MNNKFSEYILWLFLLIGFYESVNAYDCSNPNPDWLICEDWDQGDYPDTPWPGDGGPTYNGWECSNYGCGPDGSLTTAISYSGARSLLKVNDNNDCVVDMKHDISPSQSEVYIRFYLYLGQGTAGKIMDNNWGSHFIFLNTASSAEVALDFRHCTDNTYSNCDGLYMAPHSYDPEVWYAQTESGPAFNWAEHEEEWVLVEWYVDMAGNKTKLWINEVLRVDADIDWEGNSAGSIYLSGFTPNNGSGIKYYFDDIVVSKSYIGPSDTNSDVITAASCSLSDVQAAVNEADDGDTVLIPDGSCSWTGGISTSKQIWIRAQNYSQIPAGTQGSGATTRNVTITCDSDSPLFSFTTGDAYHVRLSGIAFMDGTGTGAFISVSGSGSKPALINDIYMYIETDRFWPDDSFIDWYALGGVLWNLYVDASGIPGAGGSGGGMLIRSPRNWETPSTMGMLDTDGTANVYVENSTFIGTSQWPDIDDNGRFVARYCKFDGSWGITHGFTSLWGGRQFEYYNNEFYVTDPNRNIAGRYFWCRAGTGIFTDNDVKDQPGNEYWDPVQLDIGDNTTPGTYPQERQPGYGHDGSSHVSDPIYMWNQTGAQAYTYSFNGGWDSIVNLDRDVYINSGAKPGYAKYTYPHPLAKDDTPTGNVDDDETPLQISEYRLSQNYPNPFNPETTIKYSIPHVGTGHAPSVQTVSLIIYDILGKEVATLVNEQQRPGIYEVKWDASHLSSGVYFYQLSAGNFIQVKKLILMK